MFRPRPALLLLALGTAGALPVVELQKDVYEVALKEVGTPWLIEIYSGCLLYTSPSPRDRG